MRLLQGAPAYHKQAQYFLKYWICATGGDPIKFTPLGRAWNANDGSLGTTANAAFLSAVYAQATKCVPTDTYLFQTCFGCQYLCAKKSASLGATAYAALLSAVCVPPNMSYAALAPESSRGPGIPCPWTAVLWAWEALIASKKLCRL